MSRRLRWTPPGGGRLLGDGWKQPKYENPEKDGGNENEQTRNNRNDWEVASRSDREKLRDICIVVTIVSVLAVMMSCLLCFWCAMQSRDVAVAYIDAQHRSPQPAQPYAMEMGPYPEYYGTKGYGKGGRGKRMGKF